MSTPVSAFWSWHKNLERIRADEMMSLLPLHTYGHAGEEGKKELAEILESQKGTVTVEKPTFNEDGWRSLKKISQS